MCLLCQTHSQGLSSSLPMERDNLVPRVSPLDPEGEVIILPDRLIHFHERRGDEKRNILLEVAFVSEYCRFSLSRHQNKNLKPFNEWSQEIYTL